MEYKYNIYAALIIAVGVILVAIIDSNVFVMIAFLAYLIICGNSRVVRYIMLRAARERNITE